MSSDYCVHGDVSTFMQVTFGSGGLPATSVVTAIINEVEQRIDNETDHAWHSNRYATATEEPCVIEPVVASNVGYRGKIKLRHHDIVDFAGGTDKLFLWDGSTFPDWVATKDKGTTTDPLSGDYWLDKGRGYIYIKSFPGFGTGYSPTGYDAMCTYRYGNATTPADIKQAAILLTAANVLQNTDFASFKEGSIGDVSGAAVSSNVASNIAAAGSDGQRLQTDHERIREYERRAMRILNQRKYKRRNLIVARQPGRGRGITLRGY